MKRILALLLVIATTGILLAKVTTPSRTGGSKPELLSVPAGEADGGGSKFSTRTYPLADFTNLDVSNVVKVVYTQGDSYKVQLTGRTDWLDLMEVTSTGGTLKVQAKKTKKFDNVKKKDQPDGEYNFILHLTAPCLQNIDLGGVSEFKAKRLTPDQLRVHLGGVSKFKVDALECATLNMSVTGVSEADVDHITCQKLQAEVRGSSKADIDHLSTKEASFMISGASKVHLPQFTQGERATFGLNGASELTLSAEVSGDMNLGLAGASKGKLTFKGGILRTVCTGASKLHAEVNCRKLNANCDGASKTDFSGTADEVEIDRSGVAVNIDTSRLNQF